MPNIPKIAGRPPLTSKIPVVKKPAASLIPAWAVSRIDFEGPWCPKKMNADGLFDILEKLKGFERSTWPEIERNGSHFIKVKDVIKAAQDRLRDLKLDDAESLFSLRLTGKERLWGIRSNEKFSLLWWDPNHMICPAMLKHT